MQTCFYNTNLQSLRASNVNLYVYSAYESIVLDNVAVTGQTNFGIGLKNNGPGTVFDVSIYGSPNGVDYYLIESGLFNTNIHTDELKHVEFSHVTGFLRVSVQVDADANLSIYLHGNIT